MAVLRRHHESWNSDVRLYIHGPVAPRPFQAVRKTQLHCTDLT